MAEKQALRSSRYPGFGLEVSIEKVRSIYDKDKTAGSPVVSAFKHMGYKGKSGPSTTAIAALKRFGLLDVNNDRVTPSQRAIAILVLSEGDGRRQQAIKDAALSPAVYQKIFDQYKHTGLPSRDTLEQELLLNGDIQENAVKSFVNNFMDSMIFSGLINESGVVLTPGDESTDTESDDSEPGVTRPTRRKPMSPGVQEDIFNLVEGQVLLQLPCRLSQASYDDLEAWMKLVLSRAKRSVGEDAQPSGDEDDG